jgi:hypothetical protein
VKCSSPTSIRATAKPFHVPPYRGVSRVTAGVAGVRDSGTGLSRQVSRGWNGQGA